MTNETFHANLLGKATNWVNDVHEAQNDEGVGVCWVKVGEDKKRDRYELKVVASS